MQSLRPWLRRVLVPSRRRDVFHLLCTDDALNELSRGGVDGLKTWLGSKFPELNEDGGHHHA
jgi:hypothetical protein